MESSSSDAADKMNLVPKKFRGVYEVYMESALDERGYFRRLYDQTIFETITQREVVQTSVSENLKRGTVRGLHYQRRPSLEWKIVTCLTGSIYDVLVDLRPSEKSYGEHITFDLNEEENLLLVIPPGVAHGFQTLSDNTKVMYHMTDYHNPNLSARVKWDDEVLGISWPLEAKVISSADLKANPWPQKY